MHFSNKVKNAFNKKFKTLFGLFGQCQVVKLISFLFGQFSSHKYVKNVIATLKKTFWLGNFFGVKLISI